MIKGGYILQPRIFDKSDAAKMPPVTRELWLLLLRGVNHKDNGKYERGTGFFNLGDIQEKLSWFVGYRKEMYSKPQLTKSLRRLCEANMIATAKATRGVYVTICNYDYYQDPKNYEGNGEGIAKETRRKREGHTKNKNDKNERMKEKRYGIADNVILSKEQYDKLTDKLGDSVRDAYIDRLSTYHLISKYKDHYLVILNWWNADEKKEKKDVYKWVEN